jgi:multiple sugar transport system substrate-binding protein
MQHTSRRRLLRLSGAGALTAASGGLAGLLASGRAPAYAQGTTLHWLKFVDFVPVSDQLLRGKITDECQKALGIKLQVERSTATASRRASLRRSSQRPAPTF